MNEQNQKSNKNQDLLDLINFNKNEQPVVEEKGEEVKPIQDVSDQGQPVETPEQVAAPVQADDDVAQLKTQLNQLQAQLAEALKGNKPVEPEKPAEPEKPKWQPIKVMSAAEFRDAYDDPDKVYGLFESLVNTINELGGREMPQMPSEDSLMESMIKRVTPLVDERVILKTNQDRAINEWYEKNPGFWERKDLVTALATQVYSTRPDLDLNGILGEVEKQLIGAGISPNKKDNPEPTKPTTPYNPSQNASRVVQTPPRGQQGEKSEIQKLLEFNGIEIK